MFKVSCNQEGEQFLLTLEYQFTGTELKIETRRFPSKDDAYREFAGQGFLYLKFQIDDFTRVLFYINPHYFDQNAMPFMMFDGGWKDAFTRYMYGFKIKLAILNDEAYKYADTILQHKELFSALIPQHPELAPDEIKELAKDILTTAEELQTVIRAIHHGITKHKIA